MISAAFLVMVDPTVEVSEVEQDSASGSHEGNLSPNDHLSDRPIGQREALPGTLEVEEPIRARSSTLTLKCVHDC
jgi:hypothetical protein